MLSFSPYRTLSLYGTPGKIDEIKSIADKHGALIVEDITPYTDKLWMNLLIDCVPGDQGWNTFNYVVNKTHASADKVVLEKFTGDGYASEKVADCEYEVDGRFMTVKIRKADLGIGNDECHVDRRYRTLFETIYYG